MNQFDIMAELAADSSSWIDIAHYPPTSLCRKILLLADFAAEDPLRWNVCRTLFEHPELSRREISALFSSEKPHPSPSATAIPSRHSPEFSQPATTRPHSRPPSPSPTAARADSATSPPDSRSGGRRSGSPTPDHA